MPWNIIDSLRDLCCRRSKSRSAATTASALVLEPLEERILPTVLTVPADDQGIWTFLDNDEQKITLVLSTGPNSAASIDVYDRLGNNMDFDPTAYGAFGAGRIFVDQVEYPIAGAPAPQGIAAGDVNNDTFNDIVVANPGNDTVYVLLGTAAGTFNPAAPASITGVTAQTGAIALGDFDRDGNLDVAVGRRSSAGADLITIYNGDGDGTFDTDPATDFNIGENPASIAVADFNQDNHDDIVVVCRQQDANSHNLFVMISQAPTGVTPNFGISGYDIGDNTAVAVAAGTFDQGLNGPGYAVAFYGNNTVIAYGNAGSGAPTPLAAAVTVGTRPIALAVGDFTDDAYQDIAVANSGDSSFTVITNTNGTSFTATSTTINYSGAPTNIVPSGIAVGNFDDDTVQDIAVLDNTNDMVHVYMGDSSGDPAVPDGTFTAATTNPYNVGDAPMAIVSASFNSGVDAFDDLAVANRTGNSVSVLLTPPEGDPTPIDIGYIEILVSDADTTLVINQYEVADTAANPPDVPVATRDVTVEPFSGENDAEKSAFSRANRDGDPVAPPGGAVWVHGDIFTTGVDQDFGVILIGGCMGIDDGDTANNVGGVAAADGVPDDNGAIRITGQIERISVGFLAGSVAVGENLESLTVQTNAGVIPQTGGDGLSMLDDESNTFRNATVDIGGNLGYVSSGRAGESGALGGHWQTPITVGGTLYPEAAFYDDVGAGTSILTAKTVRTSNENFFQIAGSLTSGAGVAYYRIHLTEGENMSVMVPRGAMVRILNSAGVPVTGTDYQGNVVEPVTSGGYYTIPSGNYICPLTDDYYVAISWTANDANLDGIDDTTGQNGPVDPVPYDLYIGITTHVVYELEVVNPYLYASEVPGGGRTGVDEYVPQTRGWLVTEDITNNSTGTAETIWLADGAVNIHGVFGRGEMLDDNGDPTVVDYIDFYEITVEAGTRLLAAVNYEIVDKTYDPKPLWDPGHGTTTPGTVAYTAPTIGLLDSSGNILATSYMLGVWTLSTGSWGSTDGGYIDYLTPEAGTYYLAVTYDPEDTLFTGATDDTSETCIHYEVFVTGTSTKQTFGAMDTGAEGVLGAGADWGSQGNITLNRGDIGALLIGGDVYSNTILTWGGDLLYLKAAILGNGRGDAVHTAALRAIVVQTSANVHRVDATGFELGLFVAGNDFYHMKLSGDWGLNTGVGDDWCNAAIFAADDVGMVEIAGILHGNDFGSPFECPSIVADYDLANAAGDTGTIDYISTSQWGSVSPYIQPAFVATGIGGNVRFVSVAGTVYFNDPYTSVTYTLSPISFSQDTPQDLVFYDDSGARMYIGVTGDGTGPAATGTYQEVPIYGFSVALSPATIWGSGTDDIHFIGYAIGSFSLTGGTSEDGTVSQVSITTDGQMDISTLALSGDIKLYAGASPGEIHFWEITGGTENSSLQFNTRTDVVGINGDSFQYIRIYDGNLGWTPSSTNDGTYLTGSGYIGYRPGTFSGPQMRSFYSPQGSNPDLTVSGILLSGSIGELTVSRAILDVDVAGSVGGADFMGTYVDPDTESDEEFVSTGPFVTHRITPNSNGVTNGYFINGKMFNGVGGVIYVAGSVGNTDTTNIAREGLGGIWLADGLLHSGSGANPVAGIFSSGTVSQIYGKGPGVLVTGDIWVVNLGVDPGGQNLGGLVLTGSARIFDLELYASSEFTKAYSGNTESISISGSYSRVVLTGDQAKVEGLAFHVSTLGYFSCSGLGVYNSEISGSSGTSIVVSGSQSRMENVEMLWGRMTLIQAAGYGISDCRIAITTDLGKIATTDRINGDFTNSNVSVVLNFNELYVAHDIVATSPTTSPVAVTVGQTMTRVYAGHDINGLRLDAAHIGSVRAGHDITWLDVNTAGRIDYINASAGQIVALQIVAMGPWAKIGTIYALGNIGADITSWGSIQRIQSLTGTITGNITTSGPNATVNFISVGAGLGVNLDLNGPLNVLYVNGGDLTGSVRVRQGNIGVIYVTQGNITAPAAITTDVGNINFVMASGNIGGAGHLITSAGTIGTLMSLTGWINSTITAGSTAANAVTYVRAGNGAVSGTITSNGGIIYVLSNNGDVAAALTSGNNRNITIVMAVNGSVTGAINSAGGVTQVMAIRGGISGNITAGTTISVVMSQLDPAGLGITSTNITAAGRIGVVYAIAGGNVGLVGGGTTIRSTANRIDLVMATSGSIHANLQADGGWVGTVYALGGGVTGNVTASTRVNLVLARGAVGITGNITATTGAVGTVMSLGGGNIGALGVNTIQGATGVSYILASGGGSINSAVTATTGTVGTIYAIGGGNVAGNITATAGRVVIVMASGGNITGNVTAGGGSVTSVMAIASLGVGGNITGAINASTTISRVMSLYGGVGITGNVTATGTVTYVMAFGGHITGAITSTTSSITMVRTVTGNITGNLSAATTINTIMASNGSIGNTAITPMTVTAGGGVATVMAIGAASNIHDIDLRAGGTVSTLYAQNFDNAAIYGANIRSVYAFANVTTCVFVAGWNPALPAPAAGNITAFNVRGNLQDTSIAAGVAPGADGQYGTGDDVSSGGGRITGTVTVSGTLTTPGAPTSYGIEAGDPTSTLTVQDRVNRVRLVGTSQALFPGTTCRVRVF